MDASTSRDADPETVGQPPSLNTSVPSARGTNSADIRASDADRDQVAELLGHALAEGRLTTEEHADRVGRGYAAKTRGELRALVRDLPSPGAEDPPAVAGHAYGTAPGPPAGTAAAGGENMVAIFGGATRHGRWRVGPRLNIYLMFGGAEIDLTEAVFEQQEVVINVFGLFGGAEVKVPDNISVSGGGTGIFGGFDVPPRQADDPSAPIVVLKGFAMFGGAAVKPQVGKRLKNLRRGGTDR